MKYVAKIYFLLFILSLSFAVSAQNASSFSHAKQDSTSAIQLSFVKHRVIQSPDSLYFNIIKLENVTAQDIQGELLVHLPSYFTLISSFDSIQNIPANQSVYIPIRVSIPMEAEGEKSYLVVADFKFDDELTSQNSYISIVGKRKWDMRIVKKKLYVNAYNMSSDIQIKLRNRGNTTEMVKLDFEAGKLIDLVGLTGDAEFMYIKLLPHADTTLSIRTRYLDEDSEEQIINHWKASTVTVRGSNKIYERTERIYFDHVESQFVNRKDQRATPLNFDLQINNLLSGSPARYNSSIFGTVLFKDRRELSYQFTGQNLMFKSFSDQNISFAHNTYYNLRYSDKTKFFEFGSQVGNNSLHHTYGQGLKGEIKPNNYNNIRFALIKSRFTNDYSISGIYTRKVTKSISVNAGVTYEDNNSIDYNAYSVLLGTRFAFLRYHSLGIQLAGTNTAFENINIASHPELRDTSSMGLSYQLSYAFRFKEFSFRATNTNTLNNYISNSNNDRWNVYSNYTFNEKLNAYFIYDRTKILSTRYPGRYVNHANYNISDVGRLTFGYAASNNVYFMFGPIYNALTQRTYSNDGYLSNYENKHMSLYASTRFRLANHQSITPNLSFGLSNAFYEDTNPASPIRISSDYSKSFRAGLSYYSKLIRLNVFYNNGLSVVSRQQLLFDGAWINSESIQVRPQIEKFFKNKTIRVSSYVNYIYRMPSGRESVNFNLSLNFYLKHGWSFYASNNLYTTTRNDAELGRITNRVFNIFIGVRKSFDISQPRMKYYDYDFVFYHDVNGNKELNENERVIPNMLVTLQRDPNKNETKSNFIETQLVSDPNGRISYLNLPEGQYTTSLQPLDNLEDLYVLDGNLQEFEVNEDKVQYIPLTESYKVVGQIKINRDKNSQEGRIDLSNIRVTAQSEQGDTYAVLTDADGGYILSIPQAGHYKVFVSNVLGEYFSLEKSEYMVDFNGIKSISLDFTFNEKKRGINFNNNIFDFNSPAVETE